MGGVCLRGLGLGYYPKCSILYFYGVITVRDGCVVVNEFGYTKSGGKGGQDMIV